MNHLGYDTFYLPPRECDEMKCKVCDSVCNVQRGLEGPTCFAQAMSGGKSKYDMFVCPHSGMPWHDEVIVLIKERDSLKSKGLRAIVQAEIDELLKNRK